MTLCICIHYIACTSACLIFSGAPIGVSFVGVGVIVMLCGTLRYFHIQKVMVDGHFLASRAMSTFLYALTCRVFFLACITGLLLLVALAIMISVAAGVL